MTQDNKSIIRQGLHDGIPIAMGYYAVAFSLGIIARKADLNIFTGFVSSFLTRASAGEYGLYSLMAVGASYGGGQTVYTPVYSSQEVTAGIRFPTLFQLWLRR